eukprot:2071141-Pleurochrysis_carterae.AAC.1
MGAAEAGGLRRDAATPCRDAAMGGETRGGAAGGCLRGRRRAAGTALPPSVHRRLYGRVHRRH